METAQVPTQTLSEVIIYLETILKSTQNIAESKACLIWANELRSCIKKGEPQEEAPPPANSDNADEISTQ